MSSFLASIVTPLVLAGGAYIIKLLLASKKRERVRDSKIDRVLRLFEDSAADPDTGAPAVLGLPSRVSHLERDAVDHKDRLISLEEWRRVINADRLPPPPTR